MTINKTHTPERNFAFGGGIAGLVAYLVVGLLPSLLYGGYAGVLMAAAIFGEPIHAHILAQVTVLFGVIAGALATAGLFVFIGASLGTGLCFLLRAVAPAVEAPTAEHKSHT